MSSMLRRMQRKIERRHPDYEAKPQVTQIRKDGYRTLHPTKGWRWIRNKRLAAQFRMARMLDHVLPRRGRRPSKQDTVPGYCKPNIAKAFR